VADLFRSYASRQERDNFVRNMSCVGCVMGGNSGLGENEKGESFETPIQKEVRMADPKWWDAFNTGG